MTNPSNISLSNMQYACQSLAEAYIRVVAKANNEATPDMYQGEANALEETLRMVYVTAYITDTANDNQDDRMALWEATLDQLVQLGAVGDEASVYTAHFNSLSYLNEQKQDRAEESLEIELRNVLDTLAARVGMPIGRVVAAINSALSGEGTYTKAIVTIRPPEHDLMMPHRTNIGGDIMECPPNCPAR